jgi:hypothetical protein
MVLEIIIKEFYYSALTTIPVWCLCKCDAKDLKVQAFDAICGDQSF